MPYTIVLYSPDRAIQYDGRTPEETGIGGGIMARLSLLEAFAALGHSVTAYVNCAERIRHKGVDYVPLDQLESITCDVLIAISTGGDLTFAPLQQVPVQASLRLVWVQGVPQPQGIDIVKPDYIYAASNFLRDVFVDRWGHSSDKLFVCYNGIRQDIFEALDAAPPARDPFAISYIGPPEKGLAASIQILRRLRAVDERYHLDVFGGDLLWGKRKDGVPSEPGVRFMGMLGQQALIPLLYQYEYCLAPQAIEEGFGIAVQEAKRAGQIVLASRVGAFGETVSSSYDGMLFDEPHMSDACHDRMAATILQLATDPARRERIRQNAQRTPWSWALAATAWVAHWDHVLRRSPAPTVTAKTGEQWIALPDGLHSETSGGYVPAPYPASSMRAQIGEARRVLIAGYYGYGNAGDEAILKVMLEQLRQAVPGLAVTVVSGNPYQTAPLYDAHAIYERDVRAIVAAARECDLIIVGGGGLFHDYWGVDEATLLSRLHWGLTYTGTFVALAGLLHKPLMLYAVGVGPLTTESGQQLTRIAFAQASVATVRDTESKALLATLGAENVTVTADPVFLLESAPPDHAAKLLSDAGVTQKDGTPLVAVALRDWTIGLENHNWAHDVAQALDRFIASHNVRLLFVPFQSTGEDALTDDYAAAKRVIGLMSHADAVTLLPAVLQPHEIQAIFEQCALVLAMRLHALILAANAHVPAVALSYDPKVRQTADQLNLAAYVLSLDALTSETLYDRLSLAYTHRIELREQLGVRTNSLRQAASENHRLAAALLTQDTLTLPAFTPEHLELLHRDLLRQVQRAEVYQDEKGQLEKQLRHVGLLLRQTLDTSSEIGGSSTAAPSAASPELLALVSQLTANEADSLSPLAESTDQLRVALAQKDRQIAWLSTQLHDMQATKAWRAVHTYWRVRDFTRDSIRNPFRGAYRVARKFYHLTIPTPYREGFRRYRARLLMNWYIFYFDRFKRARRAIYGEHLHKLDAPGVPGLVSIVLPAYNGADLIAEAIDSILQQSYPHFELIIINDGSKDETPQIIDEYARRDSRIRVVHQENRKLPRTLSRGFQMARGEFMTWTSCDNRLKPDFLAKMVASLQRHPCWDAIYANLDIIDEHGQPFRNAAYYEGYQKPHRSEHIALPNDTAELNVWPNNHVGAAFMYRSRVAQLLGDYSRYRFVLEDYDYWMRVNAFCTLRHVDFDETVYEYRFHSDSLTARWEEMGMLRNRDRLMVFEDFRRDFALTPLVWSLSLRDESVRRALERRIRAAGHLLYQGSYPLDSLPRHWVPVVYVSDSPTDSSPLAGAFTVLLSAPPLAETVDPRWNAAFTLGDPADLPRLGDSYQGWLGARDMDTLFQAIDIRAKSEHLERLEALIEAPPDPTLKASIIICTNRASQRLINAIRAASAQSMPSDDYEILVVNNDPTNAAMAAMLAPLITHEHRTNQPTIRMIACPIPGLSAARNAGIAEARGNVVCFLDDDAIPQPDWLERLLESYDAHPETGVIGGHIVLKIPEPRPDALQPGAEKYWSQLITPHTTYTEIRYWWEFPWGANWSARRQTLLQIGGFRSQYGRTGGNFWGGEEIVAACLAQRMGYRIAVQPAAVVQHDVEPERFTWKHVRRTILAGQLVSYFAQRDLYIPMESSLKNTLKMLLTHHHDLAPQAPRRYRLRHAWYRKQAQLRLLLTQLQDMRHRRRKTLVASDPCDG